MDDFEVMDLFPQLTTVRNAPAESISLAVERAAKDSVTPPGDAELAVSVEDLGPILTGLWEGT